MSRIFDPYERGKAKVEEMAGLDGVDEQVLLSIERARTLAQLNEWGDESRDQFALGVMVAGVEEILRRRGGAA